MPPKTKSDRREFVQLADTFDPSKHLIAGHYLSEKLDGKRCFWDGGITRGLPTISVPWANVTDPKTGEPKPKVKPISTGLWSRYGNPIAAPDSFLNTLPCCPLDGELWAGRNKFQLTMSICSGDDPDPRFFDQIAFAVYSSPSLARIFMSGTIKNTNFNTRVELKTVERFIMDRLESTGVDYLFVDPTATFEKELVFLRGALETQNDHVFLHRQIKLSDNEAEARAYTEEFLQKLLDKGGEGVVIRDGSTLWTPKRHKGVLKYKPYKDSEAVVIGYVAGKEGKQGNVLGKIGALKVRTTKFKQNVEFEIGSGLTFEEREFAAYTDTRFAAHHAGADMPPDASGKLVPLGATITFKYRELSDEGIPKEGRYWRRREGVE